MRKVTGSILFIVSLILLASACSTSSREKEFKKQGLENINQQAFLIGNGPNSKETIKDMIEKSKIRKGGYVVILPMTQNKQDSSAWFLQQEFYDQQIIAVHILYLLSDSSLKNTDVLAIENATILCFMGTGRNKFMKLANNTRLKKSLFKASENGTLIAGIGPGASILGDYYFNQVRDALSQEVKIVENSGLGIFKNTIIDDITFFRNHKEDIQKNSTKSNFVFIGLSYKSAVWIKNEEALILRKSEIGLISSDNTFKMLNKGEEFTISSQ